MSLFQCDNCGCMENTALSECGYEQMKHLVEDPVEIKEYKQKLELKDNQEFGNYCSVCCPLSEEEWHGEFDRIFLPKGEFETTREGNLRHKKTLCEDVKKYAIKIKSI